MKKFIFIFLLLLFSSQAEAAFKEYAMEFPSGTPIEVYSPNNTPTIEGTAVLSTGEGGASKYLREDGDGTSSWQTPAGGSGDVVTVDGTAIDTTANFLDNTEITFTEADGGAGGPDDITADIVDDTIDFTEIIDSPTLDNDLTIDVGVYSPIFTSATTTEPELRVQNTNDDSNGPRITLRKAGATPTPADSDRIGVINFQGDDSTGVNTTYVQMVATSEEVANGDEAGAFCLRTMFDDGSPAADQMFCIFGDNGTPGQGYFVFNEDNQDMDFRIESGTEPNFFYIDAGSEWLRLGDWDTNYTSFSVTGAIDQAGSATANFLTLTEGGNAVYSSGETPSGELGGTYANITIDDSVAVTSWNLTTPTITTSLTTSTPTTLTVAELDRLDGLGSAIIEDDAIDAFSELDAIVTDKALVNKADGAVWTGTHDFGGATATEIENTAGDVTLANAGEIAVDSTQEQLVVHDGAFEIAIPLRHMIFGNLGLDAAYDRNTNLVLIELDSTIFPDGIVITGWEVDATKADPTTELDANLMNCDDPTTGAFPGADPTLIDVLNTTTGNSSEADMSSSDLTNGIVAAGQFIYIDIDADPVDTDNYFMVKIEFYIPES